VDATNNLKTTSGTTLATSVEQAGTDGSTFIFYRDSANVLWSATLDTSGTTPALANQSALRTAITTMGAFFESGYTYPGTIPAVSTGRIPIMDTALDMLAVSSVVDYNFDYPTNETNEIMAYQCAIDFKRKQNNDFSALQMRLGMKTKESPNDQATGLWGRFEASILNRDDYRPERIGNSYNRSWW